MAEAINIIIDESRTPYIEFIEIEDDSGKSIKIGDRLPDGIFTKIRITIDNIKEV